MIAPKNDAVSHTAALIERLFEVHDGELLVEDVAVREIANRFGTPTYVYSDGIVRAAWRALRDTFGSDVDLYYSMKANPNRAFLSFALESGDGIEVASAGEIEHAVEAGCPPERIVFAGPGKTDAELEFATRLGIGEIHVESLGEARRLALLANRVGRTPTVSVRVNPDAAAQGGAMRMGGKPTPFGIDEDQLDESLDGMLALGLDVRGVHVYSGTQILDADVLLTQYRHALGIARRVAARIPGSLRTIDLGGGLGIPYFSHERSLDLDAVAAGFRALDDERRRDDLLRRARFLVEPGRFLVGESGLYLTRVLDVKESRGKTFAVLDGGMHHHLAASGNLGQTIKRNYPIVIANRLGDGETAPVDVVGPLCTPLDTLGRGVELPRPHDGDLVVVLQSGAYGRTSSPLGFLGHPLPAEVLVRGRSAERLESPPLRGRTEDEARGTLPFARTF